MGMFAARWGRLHPECMAAVAYIRVSTDDQTSGPEAQRARIEAWAAREGIEVASWHVDHGISGAAPIDRRPALMEALDAVRGQNGEIVLVAARRCRLGRDVVNTAMIERLAARAGAMVVTADGIGAGDTPEGQLMRTMVDAFAQYERALIRSRTKAALTVRKRQGKRVGQVPYGHRLGDDGVHLVDAAEEQAVVERIGTLSASGMSQRAIAARLNADGVPARGSRWHPTTVGRLLRRNVSNRSPPGLKDDGAARTLGG